jgi:hypothetical protein
MAKSRMLSKKLEQEIHEALAKWDDGDHWVGGTPRETLDLLDSVLYETTGAFHGKE